MIKNRFSALAAGLIASIGLLGTTQAETVGVGTMSQGTISYSTGSALAKVMNEEMGLQARVQPNSGETTLLPLINSGDFDFGIANVLEVYEAYHGEGTFAGREQPNLRVAASMYPLRTAMFVREDSDIYTLDDLKGKRVTFGFSAMGSISVVMESLLANAGLTPGDIQPVMVPNVVAGAEQLQNGRADAFFFAVGGAKTAEVNAVIPLRVIPMNTDAASVARMQEVFPEGYIATAPPLPNFAGVSEPTPVLTYDNMLVTNASVSDERIRAVLDGMVNNIDALAAGMPLFRGLNPDQIYKESIQTPYHPAVIEWASNR